MHKLARMLLHLGATGLFFVGVLDSSFLVMPMGNDLLLVALASREQGRIPLYVVASAAGSAAGVCLIDLVTRNGGEKVRAKMMKPRHISRLKKWIEQRAAVMLITASLAPPPFPFSAVIAGTSALQYPRARLLGVVFAA